jgi:hypothetical protein
MQRLMDSKSSRTLGDTAVTRSERITEKGGWKRGVLTQLLEEQPDTCLVVAPDKSILRPL